MQSIKDGDQMKKKFIKRFIIAMFMIFSFAQVLFLTSCGIEEVNIEKMELNAGAPTEIIIGDFDYSKYSFTVTYKDGETKTIELTREMLSDEDYLKIYRDGKQTLTAKYLNVKCEFELNVKRFTFDSSLKLADDLDVIYDGNAHGLQIVGALPEGTTVTYSDNNQYYDVGTYEVTAVLVNSLYVTTSIKGTLKINQAKYDMSGIKFEGATFDYDGSPKSISVSGDIPKGLEITYTIGKADTNAMTEANEEGYTVVAHFDAGGNYLPIDTMSATMIINKAEYDLSGVDFSSKSYTYDGTYKSIKVTNLSALPKGVTVKYEGNDQKTVGSYPIKASFTGDTVNYKAIPDMEAVLTITPAKITLQSVIMENESFVYDRSAHFVNFSGSLPTGVTFSRYEYYEIDDDDQEIGKVDAMINVGRYIVKAIFLYSDKINYDDIDPLTCIVEITKADITDAVFENTTFEYDGFSHSIYVSNLPDGVVATYTNNAQKEVGNYVIAVSFKFTPGSDADRNYNELNPMTATMSITKATMGRNFDDVSLEYAGDSYNYDIQDYYGNNGSYLGKKIVIKCGENELENNVIYEYIPKGVSIYYTKFNTSTKVETPFDGESDPGETMIYVYYYTENLEIANDCYNHYDISQPVLTTANINGEDKSVYILSRKYLMLNITKKEYVPTFINQLSEYTGGDISVLINTANDLDPNGVYPNLSFASGYETTGGVYTNNVKKDAGIYQGSVQVKLSDAAKKYYTVADKYEFIYAIKDENGQVEFNPGIADTITDDYDTNVEVYKISNNVTMPNGMGIDFIYVNDIVKPGSYAVKVCITFEDDNNPNVVSYADAAKYYYCLPSDYTAGADGSYSKIITYTINHMLYTPSFNTEYEYAGGPVVITGIDLPNWIEATYYVGEEEVKVAKLKDTDYVITKPDTYHITAKLRIVDEEKDDYYTVDANGIEFDITVNKGHYSDYKIIGSSVKYDGKLHNIEVIDLPDGITYTTSLGEGRKEVGVYKDVIIYFTNNSEYYEDLDNVKLTMTIENNVVSLGGLDAYVKTQGNKNVKQFSSLKSILSDYIDLSGATVEWKVDYYANNVIYPSSYENRHGLSTESADFSFTESTTDDEFVACSFTIRLNNGYVFDDSKKSTSYSGNLTLAIAQTKKVEIGDLVEISNDKEIHVSQDAILDTIIYSYIPAGFDGSIELVSWKANYYNALTPYPTDHENAHASSDTYKNADTKNRYVLATNTWGSRYCYVEYSLKVIGDYCFYDNGQSYQTYSSSFKCLVDQNVVRVDDYFINEAIAVNGFNAERYSSLEAYLERLIDTNYVTLSSNIFDSNGQAIAANANGKHILDATYETSKVDIDIELKGTAKSFETRSGTTINVKKADVILDNPEILNIEQTFALAKQKSDAGIFIFEQYVQPGKQYIGVAAVQYVIDRVNYSLEILFPSGLRMKQINDITMSLTEVTQGDNKADIWYVFDPLEGYCYINSETGEREDFCELHLKFGVIPVEIISTEEFTEYAKETQVVSQYSDIGDSIKKYIDSIEAITGDILEYKWSAAYYDGTQMMSTGLNVVDSTDKVNGVFDLATTGNQYVNLVLNLSTAMNSGYIFDIIEKEYQVVIRYEVSPRTVFEEPKLQTINNVKQYKDKDTTLQSVVNSFALNSNISLASWKVEYGTTNKVTERGAAENVFKFSKVDCYHVTLTLKMADGTVLLENGKYYETYIVEFDLQTIVMYDPLGLYWLNLFNPTVDQYKNISEAYAIGVGTDNIILITDFLQEFSEKTNGTGVIKWSLAYYDGENLISDALNIKDRTDELSAFIDRKTSGNEKLVLTLNLTVDKDKGYIFKAAEETNIEVQVKITVNERIVIEDDEFDGLNTNEKFYVAKKAKLTDFVDSLGLNSNLKLNSYAVKNNGKYGNASTDLNYAFMNIGQVELKLEFVSKDGYCIKADEKYLTSYTVEIIVTVKYGVAATGVAALTKQVNNVEQYTDLSSTLTDAIEAVKTAVSNNISIKWSGAYYSNGEKLGTGLEVNNATTMPSGLFDLATGTNEEFVVDLELIFDENGNYIFADRTFTNTFRIVYNVSAREEVEETKLTSLDGSVASVDIDTTLADLVASLNMNSNIEFSKWQVESIDGVSATDNGTSSDSYLFTNNVRYVVKLTYVNKDGYCMKVNNNYYEEYTFTLNVDVASFNPIKLNNTSAVVNSTANIGTVETQKNYSVIDAIANTSVGSPMFESIEFKVGDGSYTALTESCLLEELGSVTYTFKCIVKYSNSAYIKNVVCDKDDNIIAYRPSQDDTTNACVYIEVEFNVNDFTVIDFTTAQGTNKYSYNDAWSNLGINTANNLDDYITYGISSYVDVVSRKVGTIEVSSSDSLESFKGSTQDVEFVLKAKFGYAFDADGIYVDTFTYDDKVFESQDATEWIADSDEKIVKMHTYKNGLICATSSFNFPESSTNYSYSYNIKTYDAGKTLLSQYQPGGDTTLSTYWSDVSANCRINEIDYTVTKNNDYYIDSDDIWMINTLTEKIYIFTNTYKVNITVGFGVINLPTIDNYCTADYEGAIRVSVGLQNKNVMSAILYKKNCISSIENTVKTFEFVYANIDEYSFKDVTYIENYDITKDIGEHDIYNIFYLTSDSFGSRKYHYIWVSAF